MSLGLPQLPGWAEKTVAVFALLGFLAAITLFGLGIAWCWSRLS